MRPDEEYLSEAELRALQRRKLGRLLEQVCRDNRFYRAKLGRVEFDAEKDALEVLPLTTREELQRDQQDHPPYGSNLTYPIERYTRVHQTSGSTDRPLYWLDCPTSWSWWHRCWGTIYRAAGVAENDRLAFPFSFGPFIGFWGAFESAAAMGHFTLPCGGMTTSARLRHLLDHEATFVCCTPTYALRMAEVAAEEGLDLAGSRVRGLIVAGEPGGHVPEVRQRMATAWGARVFDHPGLTEAGPWGFECAEAPDGVHVMESEFIAEIIDPQTEAVLAEGQAGELVLTNLGRVGSPVIRYRTGDSVALTRGRCSCGRWFARAEAGVRGRVDDMLLIRGNNVYPSAVEGLVRSFEDVVEFRIRVSARSAMAELVLEIEPRVQSDPGLGERIAATFRDRLHFKPVVRMVQPGSLPRFELKARRVVREDSGN